MLQPSRWSIAHFECVLQDRLDALMRASLTSPETEVGIDMQKEPIGKLDHIGIAVKSLVEARKFWEGVMGAKFMYDAENPRAGFKLVELDLNGLTVELLEPLGEDSFLHKYLEKKGEGMHHLTFALPEVQKTAQ